MLLIRYGNAKSVQGPVCSCAGVYSSLRRNKAVKSVTVLRKRGNVVKAGCVTAVRVPASAVDLLRHRHRTEDRG